MGKVSEICSFGFMISFVGYVVSRGFYHMKVGDSFSEVFFSNNGIIYVGWAILILFMSLFCRSFARMLKNET